MLFKNRLYANEFLAKSAKLYASPVFVNEFSRNSPAGHVKNFNKFPTLSQQMNSGQSTIWALKTAKVQCRIGAFAIANYTLPF